MEILNYEGLLKYNEALHEDLLTNYASVLDINAVELDIETLKTDKVSVSDMIIPDSANGHAYVDLGLPSGTLWATMNVGASSETDYGNYYQYGKGAAQYAATNGQSDYSGTKDPLDSSVDTASQVWGGSWHMPTRAQMEELTANTTYQLVKNYKGSGINGGTFTATNGAVLFIPAAGYWSNGSQYGVGNYGRYWGSSPNGSSNAYLLSFSDGYEDVYVSYRQSGFSVRGVIDGPITPASPKYATKEELNTVAGTKQDVIDSSHKLSADLITNGTTNKVINVKPDWNAASGDAAGILNKPTNVSSFTNDAKYVTEDDMQVDVINANGHDYVEIGGLKWATMNIGASQPSDYGLYFQWGDTQGYTAAQVGSGEGQKYFGWADYKYGNGTSSPGTTGMTKYKASDRKTVLEASDDAATAYLGGDWRMPTTEEYVALSEAVNTAWTSDYQGSGVAGLVCTDKTDSSKVLFFPATGYCYNGSVLYAGSNGGCWSSSLYSSNVGDAYYLFFNFSRVNWQDYYYRHYGRPVRPILDTSNTSKGPKYATKAELTSTESTLNTADTTTNTRITNLTGQSGSTYTARTVANDGASFIKNANNIQEALNNLDDALLALTSLLTLNGIVPLQPSNPLYYRDLTIDNNGTPLTHRCVVDSNGDLLTDNNGYIFRSNANPETWVFQSSEYTAQLIAAAGGARTVTFNAAGELVTFTVDDVECEIHNNVLTPTPQIWVDILGSFYSRCFNTGVAAWGKALALVKRKSGNACAGVTLKNFVIGDTTVEEAVCPIWINSSSIAANSVPVGNMKLFVGNSRRQGMAELLYDDAAFEEDILGLNTTSIVSLAEIDMEGATVTADIDLPAGVTVNMPTFLPNTIIVGTTYQLPQTLNGLDFAGNVNVNDYIGITRMTCSDGSTLQFSNGNVVQLPQSSQAEVIGTYNVGVTNYVEISTEEEKQVTAIYTVL